jgi:hypothetical protein
VYEVTLNEKGNFPKKSILLKSVSSYFKSSVFYKTNNFDDTDITKYVLESQDLDLAPCKKSKSYL